MQIKDYDNPVATAVKKMGGVKRAARKLGTSACVVEVCIRGFVSSRRYAQILNNHSDVPEEDLLRGREEYEAKLSAWIAQLYT